VIIPECAPWCGETAGEDRTREIWVAHNINGAARDYCSRQCAELGRPVSPVEGHPLHAEQAARRAKLKAEAKP